MPLQIIGAGYGRTGTMSTWTALRQLGFPCYHMVEVLRNKANRHHLDFWRRVADAPAAQHDWETVFADYTAAVDFPASAVWEQLVAAYPDAKVLMTLHPKGGAAWYESAHETIYFTEWRWFWKIIAACTPFGRKMGTMSRRLIWDHALNGAMADKARAAAEYDAHLARVIAAVPPDRLLVFTATDGWAPLCGFLGVPVPDTQFPNVNDRAQFRAMFTTMRRVAVALLVAGSLALAALGYGAAQLLS